MDIKQIVNNLGVKFKNSGANLYRRVKPRPELQWFITAFLWVVFLVYLGFGIFYGTRVYSNQAEDKNTKFAVKIYPYPAAILNGRIVWAKDYYQQLSYIRQFSDKTKQPFPDAKTLKNQIMDQLLENKMLESEAIKYHIRVTTKDVNDAYQKIVAQSGGELEVKKVLNELYGMTEKDFKGLVKQQVLKEKVQNEVIAQVKVAHILIKDEGRAKEVAEKAKKGEKFGDLAKQFSEDAKSKDNGGELGWLAKDQLVVEGKTIPEFDEAAFKAKKGDVVGPVKTSAGFEIIKVEDKKGQVTQNYNTWLASLKKQAKIWRLVK